MEIDFGMALVITRCLMLLAIAITLGSYRDTSARYRPVASVLATLAAGSSLSWSVHSGLMLYHYPPQGFYAELWPTIFVLCALIPILYSRGNVAKLLPRVKWLYP
ncbi:hypothetical protein D3C85_1307180 [compost metagenome]